MEKNKTWTIIEETKIKSCFIVLNYMVFIHFGEGNTE